MIDSKDRAGWFGASDTDYIVGNWKTKSWLNWWLTKLGVKENTIETLSMNAGTHKEHQILEYIGCTEMDKQILLPDLRLRVNLDGNIGKEINECKTYKYEKGFNLPLKYKRQVWVQMFAFETDKANVVAYGLTDEDYRNYFLPIDDSRLQKHPIDYNEAFISEYLPKIKYLSDCMTKGVIPYEARI